MICGFMGVDVTAAAVWSHDRGVAFDLSADDSGHVVEHGSHCRGHAALPRTRFELRERACQRAVVGERPRYVVEET